MTAAAAANDSYRPRRTLWHTIALRYMFDAVWDTVRDDPEYAGLVQRMEESWGLQLSASPADLTSSRYAAS